MIQRWYQGSWSDRRRSVRHRYVREVEIHCGNEKAQGVSSDISMHGMGVLTDKKMALGICEIVAPGFRAKARFVYQAPHIFTGSTPVYYSGAQFAAPLTQAETEAMLAA